MASSVSSSDLSPNPFDVSDNITALPALIALFIAKGDTSTAINLMKNLQDED